MIAAPSPSVTQTAGRCRPSRTRGCGTELSPRRAMAHADLLGPPRDDRSTMVRTLRAKLRRVRSVFQLDHTARGTASGRSRYRPHPPGHAEYRLVVELPVADRRTLTMRKPPHPAPAVHRSVLQGATASMANLVGHGGRVCQDRARNDRFRIRFHRSLPLVLTVTDCVFGRAPPLAPAHPSADHLTCLLPSRRQVPSRPCTSRLRSTRHRL